MLWATRIALGLTILLGILTIIGLPFGITLWAWVKLLIVPVVLAIGGFLFTHAENRATQAATERRAQDEAFQAYLDHIGELLLDDAKPLRGSKEDDEVRILARAQTLTVLRSLNGERKGRVVQFLYESGLIAKRAPVIGLSGADLKEVNLNFADLREANLNFADLSGATLNFTKLSGADLSGTKLRKANLSGAGLVGANLRAASLYEANLILSNLRGADLNGTAVTVEQLTAARDLKGATMPNGQKYEEWIKEDEESRGGMRRTAALPNSSLFLTAQNELPISPRMRTSQVRYSAKFAMTEF